VLLFVCLFIHLFIHLFFFIYVCLFIYLFLFNVFVHALVCKPVSVFFVYLVTYSFIYVSDYQLESACKDVACITPSPVTQIEFCRFSLVISPHRPYTEF